MRFDMLGAVSAEAAPVTKKVTLTDSWVAVAATLAGGAVGTMLGGRYGHPVLGLLNGFALAGNAARVATKAITPRRAIENIGAHAVATASSLALGSHGLTQRSWPFGLFGYLAGAAGSNLFLRREDTYLERLDETVLGRIPELLVKRAVGADEAQTDGPPSGTLVFTDPETVKLVQRELANPNRQWKQHPELKPDGVIGPLTRAALIQFNTSRDAPGDGGYITEGTLAAMHVRPLGTPVIHTVPVTSTPSPSTSTALTPVAKADESSPKGSQMFGRPTWQVLLAGLGVLLAGGAIYAGVSD